MAEGAAEVSSVELLLGNVCRVFKKEGRMETILESCWDEDEDASEADSSVDKKGLENDVLFHGEDGVLD